MTDAKRILWLIDASFMSKNLHTVSPGFKIDYKKLRRAVVTRCGPIGPGRVYYVNSIPEDPEPGMLRMNEMLAKPPPEGAGFELSLHRLRTWPAKDIYCERCKEKVGVRCPQGEDHRLSVVQQKGVDIAIATFALTKTADYEKLVLSSGDGDLAPAIKYLKDVGKEIVLVAYKQNVSDDLAKLANQSFPIDNMAGEVILG